MKPKEIFSRLYELVMNYDADEQAKHYTIKKVI